MSVPTHAVNNPMLVTNNKYGIHITDESDLENAASLVNSSGGDWGYVTFVIRTDERDPKRWQKFFDELRRLHLIPIVRIASKINPDGWEKLNKDEIDGWVSFLNSLNWVIQNRYVVVGNEVNLGKEWGGTANPEEYADYLSEFAKKLKRESSDFFIMPAALDSQAKNSKKDLDENDYLVSMFAHKKDVMENIDGLASHSYPYKPLNQGSDKATLRHYEWELGLYKFLGVEKTLPVFITETGWMHGDNFDSGSEIAAKMANTNLDIWGDEKIVAITPFVLNYNNPPFDHYSWVGPNGGFYDFYETYKQFTKVPGSPVRVQSSEVVSYMLPRFLRTEFDNVYGFMYVKNTGQTIWEGYEATSLVINDKETIIKPITILSDVEPGEKTLAVYTVK